jgi:hypothetical protein
VKLKNALFHQLYSPLSAIDLTITADIHRQIKTAVKPAKQKIIHGLIFFSGGIHFRQFLRLRGTRECFPEDPLSAAESGLRIKYPWLFS